jgi:hypothetical protein
LHVAQPGGANELHEIAAKKLQALSGTRTHDLRFTKPSSPQRAKPLGHGFNHKVRPDVQ